MSARRPKGKRKAETTTVKALVGQVTERGEMSRALITGGTRMVKPLMKYSVRACDKTREETKPISFHAEVRPSGR